MENVAGKVVAITGASSGIGEATARVLAAKGAKVMLGARRTDRLAALVAEITAAGGQAHFVALDVTKRDDLSAFVAAAVARFGRLDVLVNNAGLMPLSAMEALKVDEWDRMVDVNIKGVMYGIAAALPVMKAQNEGQIISVSSIAAYNTYPTAAIYCGTKFAVRAISDGLRQESNFLRVTTVAPGVTTSELAGTITDPASQEFMKEFRAIALPAEAIANAIAYAISQPKDVDVSEIIVRPTASPY